MGLRLFILFLISICIIAVAAGPESPPEIKWKPILGYINSTTSAYVDVNSLNKTYLEKSEYVNGAILVVSITPMTIEIEGKQFVIRSVVRHLVVDCSTRYMLPTRDFYFSIEKPTRMDRPLAGYEYPAKSEGIEILNKESLIYITFCPIYI